MVAAPIGTGTVAADHDGDDSVNHCSFSDSLVVDWILMNDCEVPGIERTTYDGDPAATQTTLHGMAVSEWESQQAIQTVMHNYGEDTETLASLEGRHAIASEYENGSSATVADGESRAAIRDYYSVRQINTLESFSKSQAQFAHIGNLTNEADIERDFLYWYAEWGDDATSYEWKTGFTGELNTYNYTLANGTTHEYQIAELEHYSGNTGEWNPVSYNLSDVPDDGSSWFVHSPGDGSSVNMSGRYVVRDSYTGTGYNIEDGLPSSTVFDVHEWKGQLNQWDQQSAEMITEYQNIAPDLYDAMDNGTVSPQQVRSAEGMVRYMSGDADTQSGDFRLALHHTLGLQNANMSSVGTMVVQYEGATGLEWNSSPDGDREPIYTDDVNETYEGMLFSADVPAGGFETNGSYHTDNLNGTTMIVGEDGDTTFYNGTLTIEAMYGPDGNEVQNASWSAPEYGTYDVQAFIDYLEENEDARQTIINSGSSGGDGGINWPDWGADFGGSGVVAGLVIIVAAAVSVVLLATNVFRP